MACKDIDQFGELVKMFFYVPSGIRGEHIRCVWYEGDLCWFDGEDKVDERLDGVALNVQFGFDDGFERVDIVVSDVSLVGSGVYGDALSPEGFAVFGYLQYVGDVAASGVAKSSCFVDVDT